MKKSDSYSGLGLLNRKDNLVPMRTSAMKMLKYHFSNSASRIETMVSTKVEYGKIMLISRESKKFC